MKKRLGKKKDRSVRITKTFKCKVDSPVVHLPIFQPVVVLNRHYLPDMMYSNSKVTKKKNSNLKILADWDAPAIKESEGDNVQLKEKDSSKHVEKDVVTNSNLLSKKVSSKPLVDLNRPCVNISGDEKSDDEKSSNIKYDKNGKGAVKGVFELSENFDGSYVDVVLSQSAESSDEEVEVAGSSKKMERKSFMNDLDASNDEDYNTVVDVSLKILKKMKRENDSQLNSSQSTNESESSFIKNALEDPELLSQKVKQSINYKALELLKKSIQETQKDPGKQPTRISSRKRISVADTKYKSDFQVITKAKKKKVKKKNDMALGKDFDMRSLKLLEKVFLDQSESDSDFESEIKAELNSMEKKKVGEVLEKIENRLDALMLFKESWISSDMDFDKPKGKSESRAQVKFKSPTKMLDRKDVVKVVEPKVSLNKLQLDALFNESHQPKPKSKPKGRKKKRPMSERSLNKKSKTFFEEIEEPPPQPKVKPPILKILKKEHEKVEKPKIIPYEPLIEVKDPQQVPLVEIKEVKTKDWQSFSRPNILARSYNDPKKFERRNSSDSDNKYHDTLYNLLKKEDIEPVQGPVITSVESLHMKRKQIFRPLERGKKLRLKRLDIGVVDQITPEAEYENYIGENHWTNRGKRHATQNLAIASSYPDSDYGEDDRSHEAAIEYPAYWDHTYCRSDTPNSNVNFKTQTSLSDHTYLLGQKQNSEIISIEESSNNFSSVTSSQDDRDKIYEMYEDVSQRRKDSGSMPEVIQLAPEEDEESIDPVEYSGDESSEMSFEPPKKVQKGRKDSGTDSFRKMQRKLMRALEKLKGKSKKEKFALVKKFFAEEIFGKPRRDGLDHNIKERERRKELQSHFRRLAAELPEISDKPSKLNVLQGAEAFIRELTRRNSGLLAELGSLKSRQLLLKRRLEILLSSLNRPAKKVRY